MSETCSEVNPRSVLLNRDFVLLWQGQLVSQLGNQAFSLAMMYWLMETTGSASLMGILMMLSLLPGVVLGPLAGALADRHSRLGIILVSDVGRGLMVLAVAALMLLYPASHELLVGALFVVALLGGLLRAVFQPAITASIPDLVPRDKVAAGNSWLQFSVQGSVLFGQALGGLLYQWIGAALLFVLDGVTYLLSALSESFIRLPRPKDRDEDSQPLGRVLGSYLEDAADGVRYVWRRRGMRSFLLVTSMVNFFAMPVILLLPFYVNQTLGRDAAWYGFLLAAMGAGSLVGYVLAGTLKVAPDRRPWIVLSVLGLVAAAFTGLGATQAPLLALGLFFAVGMGTGLINIFVMTLFQVASPREMRGRVMALVLALSGAASPLGMALGGVLGDATGKNIPVLYAGCGLAIGGMAVLAALSRPFRDFLSYDDNQDEEGREHAI